MLADNPLLTLFLVMAAGAAVGAIRLGPVRLGAAGALFVGLALSAANPDLSEGFTVVQQVGLALFVYTVGIASGATIVSSLKTNAPLIFGAGLASVAGALVAGLAGAALGFSPALSTGVFTGALTAAPALDAASRLSGDPQAAVGYATAYPVGVLVGIIVATFVATWKWKGEKDTESLAGRGLHAVTVRVGHSVLPSDIPEWVEQHVRFSYVRREGVTRVLVPGEELREGDLVVVVGEPGQPEAVAEKIGEMTRGHLADDRSNVEFERVLLSNPDLLGHPVSSLRLPARFGALITRVRRGDLDLLARDDLVLQAGDQLAVVAPADKYGAVRAHLGDSYKSVSEIDVLPVGLGLLLGVLLGLISFPIPGGTFQLGPAAGPLVVGMVLGSLRRTGPLVWSMPEGANLTVRHLGLVLFLAALGLSAGPAVAQLLAGDQGVQALAVGGVTALAGVIVMVVVGRVAGLSAARTAGGVAGFLGQPAVLQAADARVVDERVENAYSSLFAVSILMKILLVPLVWAL